MLSDTLKQIRCLFGHDWEDDLEWVDHPIKTRGTEIALAECERCQNATASFERDK